MSKKDDFIQRALRDGIKNVSSDELEDRGDELEHAIFAMPESMDQYRLLVELGEAYVENDCDNGALGVFSRIIDPLCYSKEPESEELFQRTCHGFVALQHSDNDYVAGKAGEIFSKYL